jgi:hypothetical protein
MAITQAVMLEAMEEEMGMLIEEEDENEPPPMHLLRTRWNVNAIYNEQGPTYVRRAYRMNANSFWTLHRMLRSGIASSVATDEEGEPIKKHKMVQRMVLLAQQLG